MQNKQYCVKALKEWIEYKSNGNGSTTSKKYLNGTYQ